MGWLQRLFGSQAARSKPAESDDILVAYAAGEDRRREAASVDGEHYTSHVERVRQLKREQRHSEAIELLLRLVAATEAESAAAGRGWGVAPWYYEQLAIIYRKEKRFADEVAILERYEAQPKAPGAGPSKLAERLAKARRLAASNA